MRRITFKFLLRVGRVLSLVLLAALGSTLLMRYAPGYFTEDRELDAAHADNARAQLETLENSQGSLSSLLKVQLKGWAHGDLGRSRHFDVPVSGLLGERSRTTGSLLLRGMGTGWCIAVALALPLSGRRGSRGEVLLAGSTAALLALPVGVLATVSLLLNKGGPVFVLALLIAVRDFKLIYRLLRGNWRSPQVLYARAQGFSFLRIARAHLLPVLGRELLALAMMSLVIALSALVPVEVVFDVPGLGQLAWAAATNRDLPVLVAVTGVLGLCVGLASLFVTPDRSAKVSPCA